jgi:thiol:disulfide interchange protein DsbD
MAEHAAIRPGGSTRLGVRFQIEPGWHIYAQEPGDAGLPTKVTWMVPDEVSVEPLQWPPPTAFLDPGNIRTFGYDGSAVLSSRIHLAADASAHEIPVRATVSWLACKELCLPGSAELSAVLPISSEPPAVSSDAALFPH